MRRSSCPRCDEDVLLIGYVPPDSNRVVEVACEPAATLFLTPNGDEKVKVFVMVAGYRRHRDTCEAIQKLDAGAAGLPEEAGDEAGEIDEAKAKELSAELPRDHEPPGPGTS